MTPCQTLAGILLGIALFGAVILPKGENGEWGMNEIFGLFFGISGIALVFLDPRNKWPSRPHRSHERGDIRQEVNVHVTRETPPQPAAQPQQQPIVIMMPQNGSYRPDGSGSLSDDEVAQIRRMIKSSGWSEDEPLRITARDMGRLIAQDSPKPVENKARQRGLLPFLGGRKKV